MRLIIYRVITAISHRYSQIPLGKRKRYFSIFSVVATLLGTTIGFQNCINPDAQGQKIESSSGSSLSAFSMAPSGPSIQINGGNPYTNNPLVSVYPSKITGTSLKVSLASTCSQVDSTVSNQPSFPLQLPGGDGLKYISVIGSDSGNQCLRASIYLDTEAPRISVTSKIPAVIASTNATFNFTTADATTGVASVQCQLDDRAPADCSGNSFTAQSLANGPHSLQIIATDKAGNSSAPTKVTWSTGTTQPIIIITQKPLEISNSRNADFQFSVMPQGLAQISNVQCTFNNTTVRDCTSLFVNQLMNSDGPQKLIVKATTTDGETSSVTYNWQIDTNPPVVNNLKLNGSLVNGLNFPDQKLNSSVFTFSLETDARAICAIDAVSAIDCSKGAYNPSDVSAGSHKFIITVLDPAGNKTQQTYAWKVMGIKPSMIVAGYAHACAIISGGVKCWGANSLGQLGNGSQTDSAIPVDVTGLGPGSGVTSLALSATSTCAVVNGGAKCWGDNMFGQLGDGTVLLRTTPVDVYGLGASSGVTQIAIAGYNDPALSGDKSVGQYKGSAAHACAVVKGGLKCWGDTGNGQLGDGTGVKSKLAMAGQISVYVIVPTPQPFPVDVKNLPAGSGVTGVAIQGNGTGSTAYTCAIVDGGMKCWGGNSLGVLGAGDGTYTGLNPAKYIPTDVKNLPAKSGVTGMALESSSACALVKSGVKCWGIQSNVFGSGGAVATTDVPIDIQGATSGVTDLQGNSLNLNSYCAIVNSGVKCWGTSYRNFYSTSAVPTPASSYNFTAASDVTGLVAGSNATSLTVGIEYSCAVVNGGIKCWGKNPGTTTAVSNPTDISGLAAGIAADMLTTGIGSLFTCATTSSGASCIGGNANGQLGNGSTTTSSTAVAVSF
jgi:alpha-tubulin suppressor-like RCC1 family protein